MKKLFVALTTLLLCSLSIYAKPLTLAIPLHAWHGDQSNSDIQKKYQPLQKWIEKKTGEKIIMVGYKSDQKVARNLASGKYDLAYIKVKGYLDAKKQNKKVSPLATVLTWNNDHTKKIISYMGYVVTKKDNNKINNIQNLKGKTFAFVDRYSASGFLYPVAILKEHGINYKTYFNKYYFLNTHLAVLKAIRTHQVDAGATWDSALKNSPYKNQYKIILVIPNIPNPLFAASSQLSQQQKNNISKALVEAPKSITKGLVFVGFARTPHKFYERMASLPLG